MGRRDADSTTVQREIDEKDIRALFERISEHFDGEQDEGVREFFGMLVRTTLRYRDALAHSSGEPLSVGETRAALDVFMGAITTHSMPEGLEKRVHDLVMMWLEELKKRAHH
jgi:hypothetical protein